MWVVLLANLLKLTSPSMSCPFQCIWRYHCQCLQRHSYLCHYHLHHHDTFSLTVYIEQTLIHHFSVYKAVSPGPHSCCKMSSGEATMSEAPVQWSHNSKDWSRKRRKVHLSGPNTPWLISLQLHKHQYAWGCLLRAWEDGKKAWRTGDLERWHAFLVHVEYHHANKSCTDY